MRYIYLFTSLLFAISLSAQTISMDLIEETKSFPGTVNKAVTKNLSEPLKAIAAYYAALGGSNCDGTSCELTTALGLGNQGSAEHIGLITKYFGNDKTAQQLVAQKCYLPPNTASVFNDYVYLRFLINDNKVTIQYKLMVYNRGATRYMESDNDEIWIEGNILKVKKKKLMQVLR